MDVSIIKKSAHGSYSILIDNKLFSYASEINTVLHEHYAGRSLVLYDCYLPMNNKNPVETIERFYKLLILK